MLFIFILVICVVIVLRSYTVDSVTLSKSEYKSLIQKMQSVPTLDTANLAHPSISYLVSSSLSFWIIDSGALTHMTDVVFSTFHTTFSAPSISFVDGSSKSRISIGNVISLLLSHSLMLIIFHMFFLILYM